MNPANRVTGVRWGSPAFEAGLTSGWEVVAVNGRTASAAAIAEAITPSKNNTTPIEMMLRKVSVSAPSASTTMAVCVIRIWSASPERPIVWATFLSPRRR
jgi:predicted metalloprotease with PDZ domain